MKGKGGWKRENVEGGSGYTVIVYPSIGFQNSNSIGVGGRLIDKEEPNLMVLTFNNGWISSVILVWMQHDAAALNSPFFWKVGSNVLVSCTVLNSWHNNYRNTNLMPASFQMMTCVQWASMAVSFIRLKGGVFKSMTRFHIQFPCETITPPGIYSQGRDFLSLSLIFLP